MEGRSARDKGAVSAEGAATTVGDDMADERREDREGKGRDIRLGDVEGVGEDVNRRAWPEKQATHAVQRGHVPSRPTTSNTSAAHPRL